MRVILKKSLEKLGREGDVVDVAAGYARNFLFRKDLAVPATPGNVRATEHLVKAREKAEAEAKRRAEEVAQILRGTTIQIAAKAGKEKLYGTVTVKEIAEAIKAQTETEVDPKKIVLDENIKALGSHMFAVKLFPDVEAQLTLEVVQEED